MNPNVRPSDRATVVGVIDPQSATTAKTTGWISLAAFLNFLVVLKAGAFGTNTTLDAKVTCAEDGSGTNPEDVEGLEITQLTDAGSDDNKQVLMQFSAAEIVAQFPDATHFQVSMTPATSTCFIDATVLGFDARYQPAAHAATVDEVVTP